MQADFYHLTVTPLDRALPQIAAKVIGSGERLLIVSDSADQRVALDRLLWTYAADTFLAHAQAGTGDDRLQPILIAANVVPANGARHVALVDGIWRDAALAFERTFHFFADETIDIARQAWTALGDRDGIGRRYWRQDDAGRWERAA